MEFVGKVVLKTDGVPSRRISSSFQVELDTGGAVWLFTHRLGSFVEKGKRYKFYCIREAYRNGDRWFIEDLEEMPVVVSVSTPADSCEMEATRKAIRKYYSFKPYFENALLLLGVKKPADFSVYDKDEAVLGEVAFKIAFSWWNKDNW